MSEFSADNTDDEEEQFLEEDDAGEYHDLEAEVRGERR